MAGNPEINRDSLDRVLTSTQFKPDDFLKKYDEWTNTGTNLDGLKSLKDMLGDYGYNSVWPFGEQELHEVASVIRNQWEERNKTVAQNREARAQIPNSQTPGADKKVVHSEARADLEEALDQQILTVDVFKTELKDGQEAVAKLKEKFPENRDNIDGIFGSILIMRLTSGGFSVQFDKNGNLQLLGSNAQAAQEIAINMNNTSGLNRIVARGMLYQSGITESFIRANTDSEGKSTAEMGMTNFAEYAKSYRSKNSANLSQQDRALLASLPAVSGLLGSENTTQIFQSYAESRKDLDAIMALPNRQNAVDGPKGNDGASFSGEKKVNAPAGFFENVGSTAGKFGGAVAGTNVDFVKGAWEQHPIAGMAFGLGSIFAWYKFFTEEFDVPGLGKMKGWKIFLGAVTGSAAAVAAWNTVFGGNIEKPTVTTAGVEVTNLAANGLTEEHEKYGGLAEKINGANFLALKNWAQGAKGAPIPPEVKKVLDEEKDEAIRGEKEQFLKKYILSFADSKMPAVSGKVNLLLASQGADKMTLGDLKNAVYEGMKDQVEALKSSLQAVIDDPSASAEDKAAAKAMLAEIQTAEEKGDTSTLLWFSCIGILLLVGYKIGIKVLLKGILYGKIARPIGQSISEFVRGKEATDAMRKTPWQRVKGWFPGSNNVAPGVDPATKDGSHVDPGSPVKPVEGELVDAPRTMGEIPSQAGSFDDLASEISTVDGVNSTKINELRADIDSLSQLEEKALRGGGLDPSDLDTKTSLEKKIGSAFSELAENPAVATKIETYIQSIERRIDIGLTKKEGALVRTLKSQLEHLKSLGAIEGVSGKILGILNKIF